MKARGSAVDVAKNPVITMDKDALHTLGVIGVHVLHEQAAIELVVDATKCGVMEEDECNVHIDIIKPYFGLSILESSKSTI